VARNVRSSNHRLLPRPHKHTNGFSRGELSLTKLSVKRSADRDFDRVTAPPRAVGQQAQQLRKLAPVTTAALKRSNTVLPFEA
jgi:hypothetical protein